MSKPTDERPKPRRRWWRFFVQFSLRSLLILTTLAAIGCWWYLQPPTHEEELAAKRLKLQRQVRLLAPDDWRDDVVLQNVGAWRLLDEHGDPLVAGRYQNGVAGGRWTVYHTSGQKAVQGAVAHGVKNGLWRTWDAEGRLLSEVTYVAEKLPNRWGVGAAGLAGMAIEPADPRLFGVIEPDHVAKRHGPTRAWHVSGKLKFAGRYTADQRDGHWVEYDEQGQIVAEGEYGEDLKEGLWHERQTSPDGRGLELQTIEYVGGRTRAAHEQLIARLQRELNSAAQDRQVAAAQRLIELGIHGVPMLLATMESADETRRLIALNSLEAIVARAAASGVPSKSRPTGQIAAKVLPLTTSQDQRLSQTATFIAYRLVPGERERLRQGLLDAVQRSTNAQWQWRVLQAMFRIEPEKQSETFATLAKVAESHRQPEAAGGPGTAPRDRCNFLALALEREDLRKLLLEHAKSSDPAVRRFVLAVVNALVLQGRPVTLTSNNVKHRQYPIPTAYRDVVEQAKSDSDPSVKAAAESVGLVPDRPSGYGAGRFSGGGPF